ncbi:MAG: hypothetical protein M0R77_00950 [Gammaproteobacteria bacterium]|nr:hypothetical protein [Acholeplasmataceae bacterium]MCK9529123.1 hypothetical protein [Gammaproteobacteria bacterium]
MDNKKGIIVTVVPDEKMPVDDRGVRVEFITDPLATIARSTLGRVMEPFLNAAGQNIVREIALALNLKWGTVVTPQLLETKNVNGLVRKQFEKLKDFYYTVSSEKMGPWHENLTDKELYEHLSSVITRTLPIMYKPPSDEKEMVDIIMEINEKYPPYESHITYVGNSGKTVRSKEKFIIGRAYVILLDKTGDSAAAIASGKLGHFGVPSQITRQDKYTSPNRRQHTRIFGEAEMRIIASYCPSWVAAEIIDRNSNKDSMGVIINGLLTTDKPTNTFELINRKEHKYNGGRPIQIVRHLALTAGWGFQYKPYQPLWMKGNKVKDFVLESLDKTEAV